MPININALIIIALIAILIIAIIMLGLLLVKINNKSEANPSLDGKLLKELLEMKGQFLQFAQQSQVQQGQSDKKITEQAKNQAEIVGKISERLQHISSAQEKISELSHNVLSLQNILDNRHARGNFGETQLADQVQATLPSSAYAFQYTLKNNKRADCLLKFPDPPGSIVVDAKFPLENFRAMRKSTDPQQKKQFSKAFANDVKKHIDKIATDYISPPETANAAMMFIPSETVYAELHDNASEVVNYAHKLQIYISSPTTLMAILHTLRALMRDSQILEHAATIRNDIATLGGDVTRLGDRTEKLQRHYQQMGQDIEQILTSSGKITKQAKKISEVKNPLLEGKDKA